MFLATCEYGMLTELILFYFVAQKARIPQVPKALEAGSKQARPSYIPSHLPAFPDPHSYIKTPVGSQKFQNK